MHRVLQRYHVPRKGLRSLLLAVVGAPPATTTKIGVSRTAIIMTTASNQPTVNLLDMASSVLASSVASSLSIRAFAQPVITTDDNNNDEDTTHEDGNSGEFITPSTPNFNARLKADGSFVTDADFAAQSIITRAVQRVSNNVRILGEENPDGVAKVPPESLAHASDKVVQDRCRREVFLRFKNRGGSSSGEAPPATLPLSPSSSSSSSTTTPSEEEEESTTDETMFQLSEDDEKEVVVEASRVCVIIDPLDGTSSYAKGKYNAVSVLISVNVDYQPHFGVICKPFGYDGLSPIMDSGCAAVYGGPLIGGGFIAGGSPLQPLGDNDDNNDNNNDLPRAVISSSRSKGVVEDVCKEMGVMGVINPEPMHISGAGEKSLRLVLRRNNEGLWFFPRSGTSLWDIAASDAILRALGGKVTDKFGRPLDYSKSRTEAENIDGVIACSNEKIHEACMKVFQGKTWGDE